MRAISEENAPGHEPAPSALRARVPRANSSTIVAVTKAANATEIRATLGVTRGDRDLGTLQAGKNAYTIEQQVSNEVGIRSDPVTGEDLFVIAEQIDPDGTVYFRVFVKPLVNLIWIAGFVFVLGSAIALWPDAREQRKLVSRTREIGIPATR